MINLENWDETVTSILQAFETVIDYDKDSIMVFGIWTQSKDGMEAHQLAAFLLTESKCRMP
jgi:hypothetical protein